MDLQQLRYVVEVAAARSFTRAAERCLVTQSALSHQIAALERELGARLFVRSSREVRVTEAGESFLPHARAAVAAAEDARHAVGEASDRLSGVLRVGVIPTVAAVDVPRALSAFCTRHPGVRVELTMGNSDDLATDVRQGSLDVALLGLRTGVVPRGVGHREVGNGRHVAILAPDHALAQHRRLHLRDLVEETFADFPAGTSGRVQSDAAFTAAGLQRDVAFEATTAPLMIDLVAEGLAIALLDPGTAARAGRRVRVRPLVDGPSRTEHVVWAAQAPRRVARAFLDVLTPPAVRTEKGRARS